MITPAEIKKKALRAYPRYLSTLITGASFFPFGIRFGTRTPKGDFHEFDRLRTKLLDAARSPQKPGYSVELSAQFMRRYGEQLIPTHIFFETETDYLAGIDKKKEAAEFKSMLDAFLEDLPASLLWLSEKPQIMLPYLSVYPQLLKICLYFNNHPNPGCYIRELPIEVHTKFIENHTRILKPLLEAVLPKEAINSRANRFTMRFGLKDAQALIRFRVLSSHARQALDVAYEEVALPVTHFEEIDFSRRVVVIIENLMTYLTWPIGGGDVAIFGKGFQVGLLENNESLHSANLLYWGDLDAQGFMILSQLRSKFPDVQSFLMDRRTYEAHRQYVVDGKPCPAEVLSNLTPEESALFDELKLNNFRLEQEHIPLGYVESRYVER